MSPWSVKSRDWSRATATGRGSGRATLSSMPRWILCWCRATGRTSRDCDRGTCTGPPSPAACRGFAALGWGPVTCWCAGLARAPRLSGPRQTFAARAALPTQQLQQNIFILKTYEQRWKKWILMLATVYIHKALLLFKYSVSSSTLQNIKFSVSTWEIAAVVSLVASVLLHHPPLLLTLKLANFD